MTDELTKKQALIKQAALRNFIENSLGREEWLTVYRTTEYDSNRATFFSYFFPEDRESEVLERTDWEKHIGNGLPGFITEYGNGEEKNTYLRYGDDDGFEPLIIYRSFHDVKSRYLEVSEEFRLFYNLY